MSIAELLRATWYVAVLGGAGLGFFFAFFARDLAAGDTARLRRWRALAFALGSAAAVALLTSNVSDLAGGSTILDAELWEIILGSPAGMSYGLGLIGLVIAMAAVRGVAFAGGFLACASFTLLGHTPGADVWPLPSALLIVHLLVGAFWIGSLPPLAWAARRGGGARHCADPHLVARRGLGRSVDARSGYRPRLAAGRKRRQPVGDALWRCAACQSGVDIGHAGTCGLASLAPNPCPRGGGAGGGATACALHHHRSIHRVGRSLCCGPARLDAAPVCRCLISKLRNRLMANAMGGIVRPSSREGALD